MKKIAFILAAAAVILSSACSKTEDVTKEDDGTVLMSLSINNEAGLLAETKVDRYLEVLDAEKTINDVQFLIFDKETSELDFYSDTGEKTETGEIRVPYGDKWIWAVVNGPELSNIKDMEQLKNTVINLSDNSGEKGFVMAGCEYTQATSKYNTVTIDVARLVSRIALVYIKNNLYSGDLKVERVFLSNVKGNILPEGKDPDKIEWLNKEGRMDEATIDSTHVIDGSKYTASLPELTYKEIGQTIEKGDTLKPEKPFLFYAFPNLSDKHSVGFSKTFTEQATALVIVAEVNGKTYYYPIPFYLNELQRNRSCTIGVTISGPGSVDPNIDVNKFTRSSSIYITPWAEYSPANNIYL